MKSSITKKYFLASHLVYSFIYLVPIESVVSNQTIWIPLCTTDSSDTIGYHKASVVSLVSNGVCIFNGGPISTIEHYWNYRHHWATEIFQALLGTMCTWMLHCQWCPTMPLVSVLPNQKYGYYWAPDTLQRPCGANGTHTVLLGSTDNTDTVWHHRIWRP